MGVADSAYLLAVILGIGLAALFAYLSFQRRSIELANEPTLPRYFTRQGMYWLGTATYVLLVAGVFALLITEWMPIEPLFDVLSRYLPAGAVAELFASLDGRTLVPLITATAFLVLTAWESRLNPLLILRDTVYDLFAVPRKAIEVFTVLKNSRLAAIEPEARQQIVDRLLAASVDAGDFDKAGGTVEYKWAQNCVLFDKIQSYADQPSYRRFFTEPSLKWGDICISFNQASEQVLSWKSAVPHYTKTVHLLEELDRLNGLLCRLLACLVIFGSASEEETWETVRRLGGDTRRLRLKHTWKYLLIFSAAIVLGVMCGREFSVLLNNMYLFPDQPLRHFSFDTLRWIVYALPMYLLPIAVVFIARVTSPRITPGAERYYGFYTLVMVIGFVMSAAVSALILGQAANAEAFDFLESFTGSMRWGILPGLMCGFVAYQMDSPVPEREARSLIFARAALRLGGWALVALVIMLYATDDLTPGDLRLRFTVVITVMFIVGFLGAAARFKATLAPGNNAHNNTAAE